MKAATRRFFFAHLRDGRALRKSPLTWMVVGSEAEFLPDALLARAVQNRLGRLVDEIGQRLLFVSKGDRARRLRNIFDRNIVGGEHWSSLAPELFVSRRQFFRERKLLCDELCSLLERGSKSPPSTLLVQPKPEDLVFNDAVLAFQSGKPRSAERIVEGLCASLPPGELRARTLTFAAHCAIHNLRFDVASARCELAAADADEIGDFATHAITTARVNVTRGLISFMLSDYKRAGEEVGSALRALSQLSPAFNDRRSDLMQAILIHRAETAISLGDLNGAVEHAEHLRYAISWNDLASEAAFDLASIEAATQMFAGQLQCALTTLSEAYSSAARLGFNRQIVRLAIERAWIESIIDRKRGQALAAEIARLGDAVQVPYLKLETSLFCASNASPPGAFEYASQARAMAPRNSEWACRAIRAQAKASLKLGRIADAWGLATEAERLTVRLGNHRSRASSLALMAQVKMQCGDTRAATILKSDAEELLRLYGPAPERRRLEEL